MNCKHSYVNNLGGAKPTFCEHCGEIPNIYEAISEVERGEATMDAYLFGIVKSGEWARRGIATARMRMRR